MLLPHLFPFPFCVTFPAYGPAILTSLTIPHPSSSPNFHILCRTLLSRSVYSTLHIYYLPDSSPIFLEVCLNLKSTPTIVPIFIHCYHKICLIAITYMSSSPQKWLLRNDISDKYCYESSLCAVWDRSSPILYT